MIKLTLIRIISFSSFDLVEVFSIKLELFTFLADSLPFFYKFVIRPHLKEHDLAQLFVVQIYSFFPYIKIKNTKL